ncbi:MAG: hypothetical protein R3D89_08895 [Sphingomonadaceae bacterium]
MSGSIALAIILLLSIGLIAIAYESMRKSKEDSQQQRQIDQWRTKLSFVTSIDELAVVPAGILDYRGVQGEEVLAWAEIADEDGRVLITNKAFVIETERRNDRVTFGSVAKVDSFLDGLIIRKRTGRPKIIKIVHDGHFIALAERILHIVN